MSAKSSFELSLTSNHIEDCLTHLDAVAEGIGKSVVSFEEGVYSSELDSSCAHIQAVVEHYQTVVDDYRNLLDSMSALQVGLKQLEEKEHYINLIK